MVIKTLDNVPDTATTPRKRLAAVNTDAENTSSDVSPVKMCRSLNLELVLPSTPEKNNVAAMKRSLTRQLPSAIVGRDTELSTIKRFILDSFQGRGSVKRSLYISGAPGTGKTACVTSSIEQLKKEKQLEVIYVNCMNANSPSHVLQQLAGHLGVKETKTRSLSEQIKKAIVSQKLPKLLILDEIDQLKSGDQHLLYSVFDWPYLEKSCLLLIGIANALDLTESLLPRLHAQNITTPQMLNFKPYSRDEIVAIIQSRIEACQMEENGSLIDPMAIRFCASKVSACAGDVRKALDICRKSLEKIVSLDASPARTPLRSQNSQHAKVPSVTSSPSRPNKVGLSEMAQVVSEVYSNKLTHLSQPGNGVSGSRSLPLQQKLLLCTLLAVERSSKKTKTPSKEGAVTIGRVFDVYCDVCRERQMTPVDLSDFVSMCDLLQSQGLIGVDRRAKVAKLHPVHLSLDQTELEHVLHDQLLFSDVVRIASAKFK